MCFPWIIVAVVVCALFIASRLLIGGEIEGSARPTNSIIIP